MGVSPASRYLSGNLKCLELPLCKRESVCVCTEDRSKSLLCMKSDKKFNFKWQVGWVFERSCGLGSVQSSRDEGKVHLKSQKS